MKTVFLKVTNVRESIAFITPVKQIYSKTKLFQQSSREIYTFFWDPR